MAFSETLPAVGAKFLPRDKVGAATGALPGLELIGPLSRRAKFLFPGSDVFFEDLVEVVFDPDLVQLLKNHGSFAF